MVPGVLVEKMKRSWRISSRSTDAVVMSSALELRNASQCAGGGDRTHTPLAGPRILSLPDCNFLTSAETPTDEIMAGNPRISIHACSGSLVAALARVSPVRQTVGDHGGQHQRESRLKTLRRATPKSLVCVVIAMSRADNVID